MNASELCLTAQTLPLEHIIRVLPAEEAAAADAPPCDRADDPRAVLDAHKRGLIVALLRLGATRRMAAAEVGCAHRTIARTAARDAAFAAEVATAESRADGKALRLIDRATDQEKYWRAAAWVLERRNPEEFGRRTPHTYTRDHVLKLFTRFLHAVMPKLPAECRDTLLDEYEDVLSDLTNDPAVEVDREKFEVEAEDDAPDEAPVPAPPAPPPLEKQCPRDEAAARAWLEGLSIQQVIELSKRAEEKPDRPDWNHWRVLVEDVRKRKFKESLDDYRQECLERRARKLRRKEAIEAAAKARCAPPNTSEGQQSTNDNRSVSHCTITP